MQNHITLTLVALLLCSPCLAKTPKQHKHPNPCHEKFSKKIPYLIISLGLGVFAATETLKVKQNIKTPDDTVLIDAQKPREALREVPSAMIETDEITP